MNGKEIIKSINIEKLYQHVMHLEGIRHAIQNPAGLNEAADYIREQLTSYGLETRDDGFQLSGSDFPFRNVEGIINEGQSPEILVTSHYDTVRNSPGADDNASAIAVMLETARVLKENNTDVTVRFISFAQEEPDVFLEKELLDHGKKIGLLDDRNRSRTYHSRMVTRGFMKTLSARKKSENWKKAFDAVEADATPEETSYLKKYQELYPVRKPLDQIGKLGLHGSNKWAGEARKSGKKILGVINLEMVGFTSKKPHSQKLPEGIDYNAFLKHKIKEEEAIGDFIMIISDEDSSFVGQAFYEQCRHPEIDLPAALLSLPMGVEQIARNLPDLLRSDHAPFWKEGYPALMITDTANFRNPYYHTPADRINTLDFDFMKKVCQVTAMTVEKLDKK